MEALEISKSNKDYNIAVKVDSSEIDEAIQKARTLNQELQKASKLLSSLTQSN